MDTTKDFTPSRTFNRFKEITKVKINDVKYDVNVRGDYVVFFLRKKVSHIIYKENLYERWLTIGDVLHYIQRVNHWMGKQTCEYVKAENI